jgi:hypothetical protein
LAAIDLLGCEYLGGCPALGSGVLNKVELHFADDGLTVAVAPQGLFTLATAHPALVLAWPEMSALTIAPAHPERPPGSRLRVARSAVNVLTMRLDLPYLLAVGTPDWTMRVGVRAAPDELAAQLRVLLDGRDGPIPSVTTA